jgi:DNA-directed RNA polymerase subunit M/transcription elongation factor TFIIS
MRFCTNCQNMYYIRINSENENALVYYCRKCGNEDTSVAVDNVCVLKTQIKKTEQSFSHVINKYTKLDPTLPRLTNILCPTETCETNTTEVKREILCIRYDDINMKYIYICSTCDTVWKTADKV